MLDRSSILQSFNRFIDFIFCRKFRWVKLYSMLKSVYHNERHLTFCEVACSVFSEPFIRRNQVEHVIADLKTNTRINTKFPKGVHFILSAASEYTPHGKTSCIKDRGLFLNHI